ncbi:MAG: hypothetical protein ACKVI4_16920, partial [Actinomycetales bacterium]
MSNQNPSTSTLDYPRTSTGDAPNHVKYRATDQSDVAPGWVRYRVPVRCPPNSHRGNRIDFVIDGKKYYTLVPHTEAGFTGVLNQTVEVPVGYTPALVLTNVVNVAHAAVEAAHGLADLAGAAPAATPAVAPPAPHLDEVHRDVARPPAVHSGVVRPSGPRFHPPNPSHVGCNPQLSAPPPRPRPQQQQRPAPYTPTQGALHDVLAAIQDDPALRTNVQRIAFDTNRTEAQRSNAIHRAVREWHEQPMRPEPMLGARPPPPPRPRPQQQQRPAPCTPTQGALHDVLAAIQDDPA